MRLGMKCPLRMFRSRIYVCHLLSIPRKRRVRRRASFAVTPVTSTGIKVRAVKENDKASDKGKPVADRCDRLRRRQSRGTLSQVINAVVWAPGASSGVYYRAGLPIKRQQL